MKMDVHDESQGYARISRGRVTKLDQKIVQGIDGVYENATPPPKFIIAEAKFNKSQLSNLKTGIRQMDDPWINQRLIKAVGQNKADDIVLEKAINRDNVSSRLVRIKKDGEIVEKELNDQGYTLRR